MITDSPPTNQYVKNSKTFTKQEVDLFEAIDDTYRANVNEFYTKGLAKIKQFNSPQIIDLTMVFRETKEQIYYDSCCHIGNIGRKIILDHIKKPLSKEIKKLMRHQNFE